MSGCRSVEWLTAGSAEPCDTCGEGPCRMAVRYPLGRGSEVSAEQVAQDCAARSIADPQLVFDGDVLGRRNVVYRGVAA